MTLLPLLNLPPFKVFIIYSSVLPEHLLKRDAPTISQNSAGRCITLDPSPLFAGLKALEIMRDINNILGTDLSPESKIKKIFTPARIHAREIMAVKQNVTQFSLYQRDFDAKQYFRTNCRGKYH
ncbi:MAG: hypothetical protein AB2L12_02810 [Smithellaceae bacterium]